MLLKYENKGNGITVEWKKPTHFPPHLHEAVEMVYVIKGTLELGIGEELYHMEKGDFAVIFPHVIHHYQVFQEGDNKALYLLISPKAAPFYIEEMQKYCPESPIISKEHLHVDIVNAVKSLIDVEKENERLIQAYVQIIFAHIFSDIPMVEKTSGGNDIVHKVVEYVAQHFKEKITLEKMAYEVGVSKYILSRVFAKSFQCNFATYVNGIRLNYAVSLLDRTNDAITTVCLESGFESQRTFNRAFKERYRMTPREYRNRMQRVAGFY